LINREVPVDYLEKFHQATRQDVNKLLLPNLGKALDEQQKTNKINNLLTKLRRKGIIENQGVDSAPQWHLAEKFAEKKD
jgi:ATP-dependent DNA helicase RecG